MSLNTSRDTIPLLVRLGELVHKYPEAEVADASKEIVVIWCPDITSSKRLSIAISEQGYALTVRKAYQSPSYYVQVAL